MTSTYAHRDSGQPVAWMRSGISIGHNLIKCRYYPTARMNIYSDCLWGNSNIA